MILPYPKKNISQGSTHSPSLSGSREEAMGSVIIAAAGPGDPDLITVKAANALKGADVVLIDRLVSEVILHRYVTPNTRIIHVGKECRNQTSTPQQVINQLIVEFALQGKRVVRLKGGDVSVFSNVLDELQALIENKIPYEIIPGVTAALGAAAYAGIPLTARGYATSVRFLTYYKSDAVTDSHWQELAHTNDTLVFYMSSSTLPQLVQKLVQFGISSDVHLAVAEQATTCYQRIYECNIYDYENQLSGLQFASPSLVIIGKVVALHQQFKWLKNSTQQQQYFASAGQGIQHINEPNKPIKHVI